MDQKKIVVIDDEVDLLDVLKSLLEANNFHVSAFRTFEDFIYNFEKIDPDLIITDLHLPAANGNVLVRQIRAINSTIPIILISGNLTKDTVLSAIRDGANDCIDKPMDFKILLAKIEQLLCFKSSNVAKSLVLDDQSAVVQLDGKVLKLTRKEFEIFSKLRSSGANTVSRESLNEKGESRSLDVHIHSLRKKIKELGMRIRTVKGKGYFLEI